MALGESLANPFIAALPVVRFLTSGGMPMLRMMGGSPDAPHEHGCH